MWTGPRTIGAWEVVGELAHGGQGVVLDARDAEGRRAALKLLLTPLGAADPRDALRLEQEARLLAGLEHPGLPRVLGWGRERELPWLALEKIEGECLERLVARQGPLPPARAAAILAQVARALAHCHARGVIHRDVKPANVILEASSGRAVLVDLGLAGLDPVRAGEERARLTRTGELLGTPAYMAPEQVAPGRTWGLPSPASDLWGLGATLHHLLVGAPPYGAQGPLALFSAILRDDPPSLAARRPDLPADLTGLCDRCLQRDPALRPASAEHVAEALERGSRRAEGRRAPRGPSLVPLGGGAVLAGVLLALAFVPWRAPSPPRQPATSWPEGELVGVVALIRSASRAGDQARARELTDQALARWPASAELHFISGLMHARADALVRAEEEFGRALALDPGHVRALAQRGVVRVGRGDLHQAESDLRRALAMAPELGAVWQGLGVLHQARGGSRDALEAYDRALQFEPRLLDALWNRSLVRQELGDHAGALADVDAFLLATPRDAEALFVRSRLRRQLGENVAARADLVRATELDPGRLEFLRELVEVTLASGDFTGAVAACRRWSALRPEDPRPWWKAATAELMLQDFAAAERAAEEALRLVPGDPDALHARAAVKLLTGRAQEALEDLHAALARDPDHEGALLDRAAVRLDAGDPLGAIADAERLLSQPGGRRNAMAHLVRGSALVRLERWAQARVALDQAVELSPGLAQAWHNRAEARRRLGDLEGARADVRQALTCAANPDCSPRLLPDQREALEALARELGIDPDEPGR